MSFKSSRSHQRGTIDLDCGFESYSLSVSRKVASYALIIHKKFKRCNIYARKAIWLNRLTKCSNHVHDARLLQLRSWLHATPPSHWWICRLHLSFTKREKEKSHVFMMLKVFSQGKNMFILFISCNTLHHASSLILSYSPFTKVRLPL